MSLVYRSWIYRAWLNRCVLCLVHPFHGKGTR